MKPFNKELKYGQSSHIRTIEKNSIFRKTFGSISKEDIFVDVSPQRFSSYVEVKEEKNAFDIGFIWEGFTMERPSESFTIKIKYKDNTVRHIINVNLLYVTEDPKVTYDFIPHNVAWGEDDACCSICIRCGEREKPSWAYNKEAVSLNFDFISPGFYSKGVLPSSINVCDEVIISVYYRYDTSIDKIISKDLKIRVNGIEKNTLISFSISPINGNELSPNLLFFKDKVVVGTGIIDVAVFSVSCTNSYKSIAGIEFRLDCSLDGLLTKKKSGNNRWVLSLNTNKIIALPDNPIEVNLSLHINNRTLHEEFFYLFNSNDVNFALKGIQLLLQNSIKINPKIQNGSTIYFSDDEQLIMPFELKNISDRKLEKVCLKLESELFKNDILFKNGKRNLTIYGLKPNKSSDFEVIIPTINRLGGANSISARIDPINDYQDNISQQYILDYKISHKQEPKINIEGDVIDSALYVDETYDKKSVCSFVIHNQIQNGVPNNGVKDIVVSKFNVDDQRFYIQPVDNNKDNIVCGASQDFVLFFSGIIHNDEYKDDTMIVNLYYDDSFVSSIEIKFKKNTYTSPFPLSEPYSDNLKYVYPIPGESRIINILHCHFEEEDVSDLSCPRIIVNNPFCLNGTSDLHELELSDLPSFDICLNCDLIGIDKVNLEGELTVPYKIAFSNNIVNTPHLEIGEITLVPCDLSAKKLIEFEDEFGARYAHNYSKFVHQFSIPSSNILRIRLGAFVVQNLTKYEWKDERVLLPKSMIQIQKLDSEGYTIDPQTNLSFSKNLMDVSILNGQDPQAIEVWLDINKWHENGCPKSLVLILCKEEDDDLIEEFCVGVELEEFIDDNIYSLDLGTTGIVMAKEQTGIISLLKLRDKENDAIESDPFILSSIVLLKRQNNVNADVKSDSDRDNDIILDSFELAPFKSDYMGDKGYHVIVPSKFIIGQNKIPFESDINEGDINAFGFRIPVSKEDGRKTCKQIIGCLYKHIFKEKIENTDRTHIKKLVVTYPNTYSQENIEGVKQILIDEVKLQPQNISFIPESDAVAAYYFSYRIDNGDFFKNKEEKNETVVIYDMGAGTLDVSVVEFICEDSGNITASIKKKIGIPIAGNYLDYMIYKQLQELNMLKEIKPEDKDLAEKLTKEFITKYKKTYPNIQDSNQDVQDDSKQVALREADIRETYQEYINFEELENKKDKIDISAYINICSKVIFETLNLSKKNVDRVVLSGRGSQFGPLKDAIKEYFGEEKIEKIPEYLDGNLKTCVAIGALKYLQYFDESINTNYKIENRSQYQKIGVVYRRRIPGGLETAYTILLDPDTLVWDNIEKINGCRSQDFYEVKELTNFEGRSGAYYIQSLLSPEKITDLYTNNFLNVDDNGEQALLRGLVNELFYIPKLTLSNNRPVEAELSIDINNNITKRRIGNVDFDKIPIVENIENNELYKKSMWPFIK